MTSPARAPRRIGAAGVALVAVATKVEIVLDSAGMRSLPAKSGLCGPPDLRAAFVG